MHNRFLSALSYANRILVSIALVASTPGCARDTSTESGDWEAVTETVGNVTTVRTTSGSVWGDYVHLVEEASIGVADGESPYVLGNVTGMIASEDRICVLDWSVPVLRMYNSEGRHLKDIGRAGDGPGEFRMPWSLNLDTSTGQIFVRDDGQARINVYSPEGVPVEHLRLGFGLMTTDPMVITGEGIVYTPALIRGAAERRDAMVAYTLKGAAGDTILAPQFNYEAPSVEYLDDEGEPTSTEVPFTPAGIWALTPDLAVVSGMNNKYRFEIRHRDGSVTVIERNVEPVSLFPEERDWYRRRLIASIHRTDPGWSWKGAPLPDTKPFFDDLIPDRTGRIWVLRQGEGVHLEEGNEGAESYREFRDSPCWRNSHFFDVFEITGRFLGSIEAPEGIRGYPIPFIMDDLVLLHVQDRDGVSRVKRYHLAITEPPPPAR